MTSDIPGFEALQAKLDDALAPVSPLRIAPRLIPALLLVVAVSAVVLLVAAGIRHDAAQLGPLWLVVPSLFELAAAFIVIGLGIREAIPGSVGHRAMVGISLVAACTIQLTVAALTAYRSPLGHAPHSTSREVLWCLTAVTLIALPTLAIGFRVLASGLPSRPGRGGLYIGIGAGLVADAIWRLYCPLGHFEHIARAHLSGLALAIGIGGAIGLLWDRHRLRAWRRYRTRTDS